MRPSRPALLVVLIVRLSQRTQAVVVGAPCLSISPRCAPAGALPAEFSSLGRLSVLSLEVSNARAGAASATAVVRRRMRSETKVQWRINDKLPTTAVHPTLSRLSHYCNIIGCRCVLCPPRQMRCCCAASMHSLWGSTGPCCCFNLIALPTVRILRPGCPCLPCLCVVAPPTAGQLSVRLAAAPAVNLDPYGADEPQQQCVDRVRTHGGPVGRQLSNKGLCAHAVGLHNVIAWAACTTHAPPV